MHLKDFFAPKLTLIALGSLQGGYDPNADALGDPHGCLEGCFSSTGSETGFAVFDVTFSKPVSFVGVLQMGIFDGNAGYVLAYNSSLQKITSCVGIYNLGGQSESQPSGCYKVTSPPPQAFGFGNLMVSSPTPDISTVLIAAFDGSPASGTAVQSSMTPISTPEPGALSLLAFALAGLAFALSAPRSSRFPIRDYAGAAYRVDSRSSVTRHHAARNLEQRIPGGL